MQGPKGMAGDRQFCTFRLGDLFLGIDVLQVQEVLRTQAMTRVPLAPRAVRGLINLRGQIVTAIDLRTRLEFGPRAEGEPMNVVVQTPSGVVSLLVDAIGDVVDVQDTIFETPPETLTGVAKELILGVYKFDEQLLLELDIDAAVELTPAVVA